MLRRRTLTILGTTLFFVLAMAGYKGWSVYGQMQQFSGPTLPVSVAVAAVTQRSWQPALPQRDNVGDSVALIHASAPVVRPKPTQQTVVPESAVAYTLSGDWVYVVIHKTDSKDQPMLVAERRYIETGEHREGLVIVSKGLDAGDRVVTAGQLHLTNGAVVSITANKALRLDPDNTPSLD